MEIIIGPYVIMQRTKYSKYQVFDKETKKNISASNPHLAEKICNDYYKQNTNPDDYFVIEDDTLVGLKDSYIKEAEYIFLPENIKNIEESVFKNALFHQIYLPPGLTHIGDYAFDNCSLLNYIKMPNSVIEVGTGAFRDCTNLKQVEISSSIKYINTKMFLGCISLQNIAIPDSVVGIRRYAFAYCSGLKNINLPIGLKTLEGCAFTNCEKLEEINLPEGLKTINSHCFVYCSSLKEVIIPNSVSEIGECIFMNCKSLESVKLPNITIFLPYGLFSGCEKLMNLNLSNIVTTISESVFSGTQNIENINLPQDLNAIGFNAFNSSAIKSLTINYNLNDIEIYAKNKLRDPKNSLELLDKTNINKLIINNNVETITPKLLGSCGKQITSIDYLGTKEEFKKFKKNNKKFFKLLTNIQEINYMDEKPKYLLVEDKNR